MRHTLLIRRLIALALVFLSLWMWTFHSDVISLIVRQRPVLFGRYSQGHASALLVLTPLLWLIAGAFWSRNRLRTALGNALLTSGVTAGAIVLVTYLAHFFHAGPRYIETVVTGDGEVPLAGIVRHRPPNETYELIQKDVPEHPRSYPDAPPGYPDVPIRLTSDANGFRNPHPSERYDWVAVGDSFVAGSHVSDDQGWTELLQQRTGKAIYNLGVSGSGPDTYLNNFAVLGVPLKPRLALFMIYEGNDFKDEVARPPAGNPGSAAQPSMGERLQAHLEFAFKASPVTAGLRRISGEVFQRMGATRPVPGYAEAVGWMPLRVSHGDTTHYYAFDPKRLLYLYVDRDEFAADPAWLATADTLMRMVQLSREHGIEPVFLYAPSTPHVVMPGVQAQIPADQLRNFAAYRKKKGLPEPEEFKRLVFERMDNQEQVFLAFCAEHALPCLSLTPALQQATAAGRQTYYTYDQHWTPEGNAVVAETVEAFLRDRGYL